MSVAALRLLPTPSGNTLLINNFESLAGWGIDSPSLNREQAHSGQYSVKVNPALLYSLTYANVVARLTPTRLKKLRLTGWIYKEKAEDNSQLTMQLLRSLDNREAVFNQSAELGQEVKQAHEWTKVSKVFELPADASVANEIRIFLGNATATGTTYLDDLTLSVEP